MLDNRPKLMTSKDGVRGLALSREPITRAPKGVTLGARRRQAGRFRVVSQGDDRPRQ